MKSLTIVLPVFNEEKSLSKLLPELREISNKIKIKHKFLFSDNNSSDESVNLIKKFDYDVIHAPIKGYGANLNYAFKQVETEFFIFFDSDGSYDPKDILLFIDKILEKKNLDIISGNRLTQLERKSMPFLNRYFGTPLLSFLIRKLFNYNIIDCNSGMRLIRKSFFDKLNMNSQGMEFASEMFIKSSFQNCNYDEININFRKDYRDSPPHLNRWLDGWRHLRYIFSNSKDHIFYSPLILSFIMILLSLFLNFYNDPLTNLPKFHSIFLIVIFSNFLTLISMGLINFRLNLLSEGIITSKITKKIFYFFKKNWLKKSSLFFLILTIFEVLVLSLKFILGSGLFVELNQIIRIFIFSIFSGNLILLDFIFEIHKNDSV